MRKSWKQFGLATLAACMVGGCHDARFLAKQSVRDKRINHTLTQLKKRHDDGPQRIDNLFALDARLRDRRRHHLSKILRDVDDWATSDLREWDDNVARWRGWFDRFAASDADSIEAYWVDMVY